MIGIRNIFGSLKYMVLGVGISRWKGLEVEAFLEVWSALVESWPSTVHSYFDCPSVRVWCYLTRVHSLPLESREFGNSGITLAKWLCSKAKSLRRTWELLESHIFSLVLTRTLRESLEVGNSRSKWIFSKPKSLPRTWELLGSHILKLIKTHYLRENSHNRHKTCISLLKL